MTNRYDDTSVISRKYAIDIPLSCSYNRSERVDTRSYLLTDYLIDKTLDEEGSYSFGFDIYTDEAYESAVERYPAEVALNEKLYFAASVVSLEGSLDLAIRSCRATPMSEYDDEVFYEIIEEG